MQSFDHSNASYLPLRKGVPQSSQTIERTKVFACVHFTVG